MKLENFQEGSVSDILPEIDLFDPGGGDYLIILYQLVVNSIELQNNGVDQCIDFLCFLLIPFHAVRVRIPSLGIDSSFD